MRDCSVALVWYSDWQLECCGEPFSVNDSVEWNLAADPDLDGLRPPSEANLPPKSPIKRITMT